MTIKQKLTVEDDFSKTFDKFSQKAKASEESSGKLNVSLGQMAKGATVAGAAIVTAVAAVVKMADSVATTADNMKESSEKLGISLKFYQQIGGIAKRSGTEMGALNGAMRALIKTASDSATGNKEAADAYRQIGVSVTDATGKMKTQEQLFKDTLTALSGMPQGIERAAVAQKLFGRSAAELNPVLNLGSERLKQYTSDMSTSVIVTEQLAQVSSDYKDNMATIGEIAQKAANEGLLPVITVMEGISGLIVQMNQNGEFETLGKDISSIGVLAAESFKVVGWGLAEIAIIGEGVVGYFETAGTGIAKVTLEVASAMASLNAWKIKNETSIGGDPLKSAKYIEAKAFSDEMKASLDNINTELDDTITKHGGRIESLKRLQKNIMGLSTSKSGVSSGSSAGGGGAGSSGGTPVVAVNQSQFDSVLNAERDYYQKAAQFSWEARQAASDKAIEIWEEEQEYVQELQVSDTEFIAEQTRLRTERELAARESIKQSAIASIGSLASIGSSLSSIRMSELAREEEAIKKSNMTDKQKAKAIEALEKKRREEMIKSAKVAAAFAMLMATINVAETIGKFAAASADAAKNMPGGPVSKISAAVAVGAAGVAFVATALQQKAAIEAASSGAREHGGGTMAGNTYGIGEKGKPEIVESSRGKYLFSPQSASKVTPLSSIGGMGGNTYNVSVNINGNADPVLTERAVMSAIERADRNGSADWGRMNNLRKAMAV